MPTVLQNSITGSDSTFLESGTNVAIHTSPIGPNGPFANDASTQANTSISYEHHEIHQGSHYYLVGADVIANAGSVVYNAQTPNTSKFAHLVFEVQGTLGVTFNVYEDSVVSGAPNIPTMNNNRNSTKTAGMTILRAPITSTQGNLIYTTSVGGGKEGGAHNRSEELVLKSGTSYSFIPINQAAQNNTVSFQAEWYEHTDKNQIV